MTERPGIPPSRHLPARPLLERGTRVRVLADDQYEPGIEGVVVKGEYLGLLSGRPLVTVQFDGRERWDIEGFYVDQLEVVG